MNKIAIKGIDLEKNIWVQTTDTQWIKYLNISNENEHWFKVVDVSVEEDCFLFGAMTVLIEDEDLYNEAYEESMYLRLYGYDSLNELIEACPNSYIRNLALYIAETDMFTNYADDFQIIKEYKLSDDWEDIDEEVFSKCDEIEKFIKENL